MVTNTGHVNVQRTVSDVISAVSLTIASKCPETVSTAEVSKANSNNSASGQSRSQNTQGQGGVRRRQRNKRRRYGRNRRQNQQVHGL